VPPVIRKRSFLSGWADAAGAWVDRTAVDLALDMARRSKGPRPDPEQQLRQLARVAEAYGDPRLIAEPDAFFVPPPTPAVRRAPVRSLPGGGRVEDLSFASGFHPTHEFPREDYLAQAEPNHTAHARYWRHPTPRATVVCVHGYLGGKLALEEAAFEAPRLYHWGLDVLITVLPFHGMRAPGGRRALWPGVDPWRSVEGFAHAISDLRAWMAWLRAEGSSTSGVFGMSLGGYTAALLATVDPTPAFTTLMIPLASLGDAYLQHRARLPEPPPAWVGRRIDDSLRVVSPLSRPPLVAPGSVLVLAAGNDAITPAGHAERLRDHFDARFETFAGGHLLQVGRARVWTALKDFLLDQRIIAER
jgi:dienelactone hydrolase